MEESENIKELVNQVAVHVAKVVRMALRDTEAGSQLTTVMSHRKPQRRRPSGPILGKLVLNWGIQDRYIELMNFEVEVLNILEIEAYELSEVPVIEH